MYLQKGAGTPERKHAYTCGNYRNRARNDYSCTTHYIRKTIIKELVLADLRRVLAYVRENESEFIRKATEYGDTEAKKAVALKRRELDKATARIRELDAVFRKLFEDSALGRLSDSQFVMLTSGFEDEKATLKEKAAVLEREVEAVAGRRADVNKFVKIVARYGSIHELTYENVHEFIDRILVHDLDREAGTRKIEIFYSFVGRVNSGEKPTTNVTHIRKEMIDVVSIAI
jgi:hypothetical protein